MPPTDWRPPKKRKVIYGPPVPKRKPRTPRAPTKAERWAEKGRAVQRTAPRETAPVRKPVYGPPKPTRTPSKPTPAQQWAAKGKVTARVMQDRLAPKREIAGPAKPTRTPRKRTAAEKVASKDWERGWRGYQQAAEREPRDAYDPGKVLALEQSRQEREVQDRLERARTAPGYTRKILGVPVGKTTHARDVIADRPEPKAPKGAVRLSETVSAKGKTPAELAELNRILKGDRKDVVKNLEEWSHKTAAGKRRQEQMSTGSAKAAAKVLDYTVRPTYAVAGAGGAVIHGKNPARAAARGLTGKDKRLWSHNLRDLGVPKGIAGPAGLVLDVGTDPTTYLTAGTGSVAKRSAMKAARDATKTAEKRAAADAARVAEEAAARARGAGRSPEAAKQAGKEAGEKVIEGRREPIKRIATRAGERAATAAPAGKGITIKFAGKEIPGVRRGTAAYSRADRALTRKVVPRVIREGGSDFGRKVIRQVHPRTRPVGVTEAEHTAARAAVSRSHAHIQAADHKAMTLAMALKRDLGPEQFTRVIDAVERKKLHKLKDLDAKTVKRVQDMNAAFANAYRLGRQAGAIKGKVGDTGTFMSAAERRKLERTTKAEVGEATRATTRAERKQMAAAAQHGVAEQAARGSAARVAAVETERARAGAAREALVGEHGRRLQYERSLSQAERQARAERHAADVGYEQAVGAARVSAARTKTSPGLKQRQSELVAAGRARDQARTALTRAQRALRAQQAKPVARRRGVAALDAQVKAAQQAVEQAGTGVKRARTNLQTERARIRGVAPREHQQLLGAIERRGAPPPSDAAALRRLRDAERRVARVEAMPVARRAGAAAAHTELEAARQAAAHLPERAHVSARPTERPRTVPRIEPEAPGGARLERATAKLEDRAVQSASARARLTAAENVPRRSLHETEADHLRRVIVYAQDHGLGRLEARAAKLLASRPKDTARGYFPRDFDQRIAEQLGVKKKDLPQALSRFEGATAGSGRKVSRITPGFKRADQRRLGTTNLARGAAGQARFSTDVPLVALNHLRRVARATSQGEFARELAKLGRPVRSADDLKEGEALYRLGMDGGQYGLVPVGKIPGRVSQAPTKSGVIVELPKGAARRNLRGGQYVAMNPRLVDEASTAAQTLQQKTPQGELFDKATGLWKGRAVASLAFHVRNALGDIQAAYNFIPGQKIPGALKEGSRASFRHARQSALTRPTATDKTIKVGGQDVPIDEFIKSAEKQGVLGAGQFGREMQQLMSSGGERVGRVGGRVTRGRRALERWTTARENAMRLGSYKTALDGGLSPEQAAAFANKVHIDYGDLSQAERVVMRRMMPFYTWTARSLPLAAETLIQRPGKYANFEKLRQEVGNTFSDLDEDGRRERMTEAVMRTLPMVAKFGDQETAVGWSSPATLLNWGFPGELRRNAVGMVNPIIKDPAELLANRNLVTQADIEGDRPLVAAPSFVKYLPDEIKQALDVEPNFTDPRSGKKTWAWRGRADYTYDQLMLGWYGQAAALFGSGRQPGQTKGSAIAAIGGARVDPLSGTLAERAKQAPLREAREKLERRRSILNQLGIKSGNATAEYKRLNEQINALDEQLGKKKAKKAKGPLPLGGAGGGTKLPLGGGGGGGGGKLLPLG